MLLAATLSLAVLSTLPSQRATTAKMPRDALIVSPTWLAQHLNDANLVLLHVGEQAHYLKEHIPHARYVSLADVSIASADGLHLEMPPATELRSRLEKLGVSQHSRIAVYFADEWVSPATRVVFTLDYAGLGGQTVFVDGGLQAWVAAGQAVTADVPRAKAGRLHSLKIKPLIVNADFVQAHLTKPGFVVVDGRAGVYYDGVEAGGSREKPHRVGHISGARSLPFDAITDDEGRLRTSEELAALFARAQVKPGDTIVGYCHIGQQATAMLFAARTLGYAVRLYDGSFEDWSRRGERPVQITVMEEQP